MIISRRQFITKLGLLSCLPVVSKLLSDFAEAADGVVAKPIELPHFETACVSLNSVTKGDILCLAGQHKERPVVRAAEYDDDLNHIIGVALGGAESGDFVKVRTNGFYQVKKEEL